MRPWPKKLVRVVGRHARDCFAIKNYRNGAWSTPWSLGEHVFASFAANEAARGAHWSWLKFRCNCSGCPAVLYVFQDYMLAMAGQGVDERTAHATEGGGT